MIHHRQIYRVMQQIVKDWVRHRYPEKWRVASKEQRQQLVLTIIHRRADEMRAEAIRRIEAVRVIAKERII